MQPVGESKIKTYMKTMASLLKNVADFLMIFHISCSIVSKGLFTYMSCATLSLEIPTFCHFRTVVLWTL